MEILNIFIFSMYITLIFSTMLIVTTLVLKHLPEYEFTIPIFISIIIFTAVGLYLKDNLNLTEYSNLNYSYNFKKLESESEKHPGAKCVVTIRNYEDENFNQSEITNEKKLSSTYDKKFYISEDCTKFKEELKSLTNDINKKIENIRLEENK